MIHILNRILVVIIIFCLILAGNVFYKYYLSFKRKEIAISALKKDISILKNGLKNAKKIANGKTGLELNEILIDKEDESGSCTDSIENLLLERKKISDKLSRLTSSEGDAFNKIRFLRDKITNELFLGMIIYPSYSYTEKHEIFINGHQFDYNNKQTYIVEKNDSINIDYKLIRFNRQTNNIDTVEKVRNIF